MESDFKIIASQVKRYWQASWLKKLSSGKTKKHSKKKLSISKYTKRYSNLTAKKASLLLTESEKVQTTPNKASDNEESSTKRLLYKRRRLTKNSKHMQTARWWLQKSSLIQSWSTWSSAATTKQSNWSRNIKKNTCSFKVCMK